MQTRTTSSAPYVTHAAGDGKAERLFCDGSGSERCAPVLLTARVVERPMPPFWAYYEPDPTVDLAEPWLPPGVAVNNGTHVEHGGAAQ